MMHRIREYIVELEQPLPMVSYYQKYLRTLANEARLNGLKVLCDYDGTGGQATAELLLCKRTGCLSISARENNIRQCIITYRVRTNLYLEVQYRVDSLMAEIRRHEGMICDINKYIIPLDK